MIKFTSGTEPRIIREFSGKCFLLDGILHVPITKPSKEVNGIVCLKICKLEIVALATDTKIVPVDIEIIPT